MAPRKKAQPKKDDSAIEQECEEAAQRAMQSLKVLEDHLPHKMASFHLRKIFTTSASAFCQRLLNVKKADRDYDVLFHQIIASDLHGYAIEVAKVLLSYARSNSEDLKALLNDHSEWPAIVSLDPARDIRKVQRNPEGMAAKWYAPILDHLGKNTWVCPTPAKNLSVFHYLAQDIAEILSPLAGWAYVYRMRGLPWLLDFTVGSKIHALQSTTPVLKDGFEWAVAIKYYLYLALAPEPMRSQLREEWRNLRVEAFRLFQPEEEKEKQLHKDLCKQVSLPALGNDRSSDSRTIHFPAFLWEKSQTEIKPLWQTWWEDTLKYEPAELFGNLEPLHNWNDPAVVKLIGSKNVKGRPVAAFGRCVNAVLDAFLRMIGFGNGLKDVEQRKTPIPTFGFRASRPEAVSTAVRAMRLYFQIPPVK